MAAKLELTQSQGGLSMESCVKTDSRGKVLWLKEAGIERLRDEVQKQIDAYWAENH